MWKKTDEDEKELARQDLAELTKKADKGLIDLAYFDCSGFNLWAKDGAIVGKNAVSQS
ncbi:MAG: hypothetical protein M3525_12895 [Acidobacteriota bacterium]|nr:hypothetical protein [Acidobacteriota bacterium]